MVTERDAVEAQLALLYKVVGFKELPDLEWCENINALELKCDMYVKQIAFKGDLLPTFNVDSENFQKSDQMRTALNERQGTNVPPYHFVPLENKVFVCLF